MGSGSVAYLGQATCPASWTPLASAATWPADCRVLVADLGTAEALTELAQWLPQVPVETALRIKVSAGGPPPRALADVLRPSVAAQNFECHAGALIFEGACSQAGASTWAQLAGPERLLQLTEQQLQAEREERQHQRQQTALLRRQTIRSVVQTELQRRTEADRLQKQLSLTQERLVTANRSTRMRLGNAVMLATQSPLDTLRLPKRVMRLYKERGEDRSLQNDTATRARAVALDASLDAFLAKVRADAPEQFVLLFSGTTFIQPLRANRPIRMAKLLLERGVPVHFSYHGYLSEKQHPSYAHPLLLETPVEFTKTVLERIARADLGAVKKTLIVSYPHFSVARHINTFNTSGWSTVYDCRDDWEAFQKVGAAPWYAPSVERFTVNNCDASFCVSGPLRDKIAQMTRSRPVEVSPNGYDGSFLSAGYSPQPSTPVKIGYFGHLSDRWFDWPALAQMARARPHYTFEIIGHLGPKSVDVPDNVKLLGPKTHPEICEIAKYWSTAIIPFKMGPLADAVDPIKIYEYFALGLPVVSFRMPQIDSYPYTKTVETTADFVLALDASLERRPEPGAFEAFLSDNTWDHRVTQLLDAAEQARLHPFVEKSFLAPGEAGS